MKLIFITVLAFVFIISSVVCADNLIGHQHGKPGKVEACLEGIADTNKAVTDIVKDLNELIHTDIKNTQKLREMQLVLVQDGQMALEEYNSFDPECRNITLKYTHDQDTILLKGIMPLLTSVTDLYKTLLVQKDKVDTLKLNNMLSGLLKSITNAVDEFKTWSDKYGSERVLKETSAPVYDLYILFDEVNEIYKF